MGAGGGGEETATGAGCGGGEEMETGTIGGGEDTATGAAAACIILSVWECSILIS